MKILRICGKTSDRCNCQFTDSKGKEHESDSYVPVGLGIGGDDDDGDYLMLDINMETGQILNWKPVSETKIIKALKEA